VGFHRAGPAAFSAAKDPQVHDHLHPVQSVVEAHGIPLKPKPGLTPISCHAVLERSACAPFIKERRMEPINATNLHRKSGQWGTLHFLPGERGEICGKFRLKAPRFGLPLENVRMFAVYMTMRVRRCSGLETIQNAEKNMKEPRNIEIQGDELKRARSGGSHSVASGRNGPLRTNLTGKPSMSFGNCS
jgi:hypothetical protein